MTKKIFAMFLAVLMVVSVLPTSVFAANDCPVEGQHTKANCEWTLVKVVEPTCGSVGYTQYQCNECDEFFVEDIVPATGKHEFEEVEAQAPTCEKPGKTAGLQCKNCDASEGREVIPALYKDRKCEWIDITPEIDCTTGGQKYDECAHCGAIRKNGKPLEPGEHDWDNANPTIKVEATAGKPGVAVIECKVEQCPATKEVEVFAEHSCKEFLQHHSAIPATCTTNGLAAHYECRACGKLFNNDYGYNANRRNEVTLESLVIPAMHDDAEFKYDMGQYKDGEMACGTKKYTCDKCEAKFSFTYDHTFVPAGEGVDPTCTSAGYQLVKCNTTGCNVTHVEVTNPLGHAEYTVSIPANCGSYAYTFTFCTRESCSEAQKLIPSTKTAVKVDKLVDEYGVTYDLSKSIEYMVAEKLYVNVPYYLSVVQGNLEDAVLYLNGETVLDKPYYLATTEELAEAKTFYVEKHKKYDGFVLYFMDGTDKKYVEICEYWDGDDCKGSLRITTTYPTFFYTWNEEYNVLTTEIDGTDYFLGTYDEFETLSACKLSYIEDDFALQFVLQTKDGVNVVDFEVDYEGGFNKEVHSLKTDKIPATCYGSGLKTTYCINPGCELEPTTEVLPKVDHEWNTLLGEFKDNGEFKTYEGISDDPATTDVDESKIFEKHADLIFEAIGVNVHNVATYYKNATCTTAGYFYGQCAYCGSVERVVVDAYGHDYYTQKNGDKGTDWGVVEATHTKQGYTWYNCKNGCGIQKETDKTNWSGKGKTWHTPEAAKDPVKGHGANVELIKLFRDGDCEVQGLEQYKCKDCGEIFYVKQWKYLTEKVQGVTTEVEDEFTGKQAYAVTGQHYVKPFKVGEVWVIDVTLYNLSEAELKAGETIDGKKFMHYQAASTCYSNGYIYSYECLCCGEAIGVEEVEKAVTLPKTNHLWVDLAMFGYDVSDMELDSIDNPCPNASASVICYYCGQNKVYQDGLELNDYDNRQDKPTYNENHHLCTDELIFEMYICSCGEEHIRALYGKFDHKWTLTGYTPSTHTVNGKAYYTCVYCGETDDEDLELTPHVNANKEEFTSSCQDKVEDRHCVLCCKCENAGAKHNCVTNKNAAGKADPCDCVIFPECDWTVEYKPSTCTMMAYTFMVCKICGDTQYVDAKGAIEAGRLKEWTSESTADTTVYYIKDKSDVEIKVDGVVVGVKIPYVSVNFMGHKPAEVDYDKDGNELRYANYVYVDNYQWTYYKWEKVSVPVGVDTENNKGEYEIKDVLVEYKTAPYTAKFEKYVEPTYAADGVLVTDCQICDDVVEQTLPKKVGIGFELDVTTPVVGYGSLVEVVVSVNSLEGTIHGFEFSIGQYGMLEDETLWNPEMIFVGYEAVNEDFVLTVTDPAKVVKGESLNIVGHAVNTAEGKMQNIAITEKTALVKLYFRQIQELPGKNALAIAGFGFMAKPEATIVKNAATKAESAIDVNIEEGLCYVLDMMDFNMDGSASAADMYQAMTMLTGEHSTGKTYDITVDLNKDGEVTLEDLAIGYDYIVGNYDEEDILFMGMSEAEVELIEEYLHEAKDYVCANCKYESDYQFLICPKCFTVYENEGK